MPRKTPVRHGVKDHQRKRSNVNRYSRGSGSMSVTEIKARKGTIDEHKRKLKKIGDSISYLDNERRVTGVVVGIRAEYYLVERNGKVWKVDRHSVFTRIGSFLKGEAGRKADAIERANWKRWKKEMEVEEKEVLKRIKQKVKEDKERKKFREKIRKGPRIKRTAGIIKIVASEKTTEAKRKAKMAVLEGLLGKKGARKAVKGYREAEKKERRERLGRR